MKNSNKVTNNSQYLLMVKSLQKGKNIAKGIKYVDKSKYTLFWSELSKKLNKLGPPVRTSSEWQKVWSDLKIKIKKKLAHNKAELAKTKDGSEQPYIFKNYEESVVELLQWDKTTSPRGLTFSLNNKSSSTISSVPSSSPCSMLLEKIADNTDKILEQNNMFLRLKEQKLKTYEKKCEEQEKYRNKKLAIMQQMLKFKRLQNERDVSRQIN